MKSQEIQALKEKFGKGNVLSTACPSREILATLTSKWSILILMALSENDVMRFSDLRRKVEGISEKMLGQTLKNLEKYGFVNRHAYDIVPPKVEYSLTDNGVMARDKIFSLVGWIEDNVFDLMEIN